MQFIRRYSANRARNWWVSFAHTLVCRRASVLAAAGAAMIRPSNQKDQPGVQEVSALPVLNFSLSQMVIISEIRWRKCVPQFGLPIVLKVRSQVFFHIPQWIRCE